RVHGKVEYPVADHEECNDTGRATISPRGIMDCADDRSPQHGHGQTVRERIRREHQRIARCRAWCNAHLLDAEQQKDWPQLIEELSRECERPQRRIRHNPLGSKGNAVMPEKHSAIPGIVYVIVDRRQRRGGPEVPIAAGSSINMCDGPACSTVAPAAGLASLAVFHMATGKRRLAPRFAPGVFDAEPTR